MRNPRPDIKKNFPAFSVLELIVTLVIVAMISAVVLQLLDNTKRQSRRLNVRMTRLNQIDYCLDRLENDVINSVLSGAEINVEKSRSSSVISLVTTAGDKKSKPTAQIDWIAASHYPREDLILYRRQIAKGVDSDELYIPLCENLMSFQAELFSEEGIVDPNSPPAVLQVQARLFRTDDYDPEQLLTISRTFCLRRY